MTNDTAILTLICELQNDRAELRREIERLRAEVVRLINEPAPDCC